MNDDMGRELEESVKSAMKVHKRKEIKRVL
jgi:hypothetical protein